MFIESYGYFNEDCVQAFIHTDSGALVIFKDGSKEVLKRQWGVDEPLPDKDLSMRKLESAGAFIEKLKDVFQKMGFDFWKKTLYKKLVSESEYRNSQWSLSSKRVRELEAEINVMRGLDND